MTVINGTSGNDVLNRAGTHYDSNSPGLDIYGLDGNDTLFGTYDNGRPNLYGGAGNDTYYVYTAVDAMAQEIGVGNVVEAANQGVDTVFAYHRIDHLWANVENLRLMSGTVAGGNELANSIRGNGEANVVRGYGGNDTLQGLGGNDVIQGGRGNDVLDGGAGDDVIQGNLGNDVLHGGPGKDVLRGDAGADRFVFDLRPGSANIDTIVDFSRAQHDHIQLENSVFRGLAAGHLTAATFHVGTSAHDASDRIVYDNKTGALYYDADGSGAGHQVQIATLTGHPALSVYDFLVV